MLRARGGLPVGTAAPAGQLLLPGRCPGAAAGRFNLAGPVLISWNCPPEPQGLEEHGALRQAAFVHSRSSAGRSDSREEMQEQPEQEMAGNSRAWPL